MFKQHLLILDDPERVFTFAGICN